MADPAKHKSVSVPIGAWKKANFLKDKIIDGLLKVARKSEPTITHSRTLLV